MKISRHILSWLTVITLAGVLTGCSDDAERQSTAKPGVKNDPAPATKVVQTEQATKSEPIKNNEVKLASEEKFEPVYISAVDLGAMFDKNNVPFIFDVRSEHSFGKNHILNAYSMPHGKNDDARLAGIEGLGKDNLIVTYCGCPRHLSTLAAGDLTKRGYSDVRVLYEGYWHWKDNGYPVVDNESIATEISTLQFAGTLKREDTPISGETVFLRHRPTGQLEAVESAADGSFAVEFHLYDLSPADDFDVMVSALDHPPVQTLTVRDGSQGEIALDIMLN